MSWTSDHWTPWEQEELPLLDVGDLAGLEDALALAEVLEAGHEVDALAAAFADHRGQVVDRCDVRGLVESEQHG